MMKLIIVFLLSFAIAFAEDACRFEYPGKGVIDLTTVGHTDGTPAFADQMPATTSDYKYSYNPCRPFTGHPGCTNVAACQTTVNNQSSYVLGTQQSASWNPGSESGAVPTVTYNEDVRRVIVRLVCSPSGETQFIAVGEDPTNTYLFILTHKCACWDGCWSPPPSTTTTLPTTTPVIDSCRFTDREYGVIDITSLGRTDGTPAYADRIPLKPDGFKYSYNPCKPFSEGSICQNAASCRFSVDGTDVSILGTQETVEYYPPGYVTDNPTIFYTYDGDYGVFVELVCPTTDIHEFNVIDESGSLFLYRLTHKCACWNACSSTAPTTTPVVTTTLQPVSNECRFVHPTKGVIDLSFIGRTDEKAAYSDETTRTASNFKYSYNPCRSFSQGSGCIGAAVCQVSKDGQETFTLGTQESAWWDVSSDENAVASLNYMYGDKKVNVLLQCSEEGNNEFQAYGEDPVNTFKFQLTHRCVCWNSC